MDITWLYTWKDYIWAYHVYGTPYIRKTFLRTSLNEENEEYFICL